MPNDSWFIYISWLVATIIRFKKWAVFWKFLIFTLNEGKTKIRWWWCRVRILLKVEWMLINYYIFKKSLRGYSYCRVRTYEYGSNRCLSNLQITSKSLYTSVQMLKKDDVRTVFKWITKFCGNCNKYIYRGYTNLISKSCLRDVRSTYRQGNDNKPVIMPQY